MVMCKILKTIWKIETYNSPFDNCPDLYQFIVWQYVIPIYVLNKKLRHSCDPIIFSKIGPKKRYITINYYKKKIIIVKRNLLNNHFHSTTTAEDSLKII